MKSFRRALMALVIACQLPACQPAQPTQEGPDQAKAPAEAVPALSVAEPPLDRRGLLLRVADAASAAALGEDDRQRQRDLDGKRFELRLRFGCGGAAGSASAEPRRWTFDQADRVLRFHLEPDVDGATPLVRSVAAAGFEAVEGFWVRRPWLLTAGCPVTAQASALVPTAAPEQAAEARGSEAAQPAPRIAIAQFYTADDPRTHRRDSRAYQATKTVAADAVLSESGYNLVLTGRLRALPGGRVIACTLPSAAAPPGCMVSATFDQVAIEEPASKEVVVRWTAG